MIKAKQQRILEDVLENCSRETFLYIKNMILIESEINKNDLAKKSFIIKEGQKVHDLMENSELSEYWSRKKCKLSNSYKDWFEESLSKCQDKCMTEKEVMNFVDREIKEWKDLIKKYKNGEWTIPYE